MASILDLALEILDRFGPPNHVKIVVTAYVDTVYVLEDDGVQYVIVSEQVLDQLRREFAPPPDNILGLGALSGIPVMYDDRLAATILAKKLVAAS